MSLSRYLCVSGAVSLSCFTLADVAMPAQTPEPEILGVMTNDGSTSTRRIGLGTIVRTKNDGAVVLTALHIVEGASSAQLYVESKAGNPVKAAIYKIWPDYDLALLKADVPGAENALLLSDAIKMKDGSVRIGTYDPKSRSAVKVDGTLMTSESPPTPLTSKSSLPVCISLNVPSGTCAPFTGKEFDIAEIRPKDPGKKSSFFLKGNSGAPIFRDGELLGVVVMQVLDRKNVGIMVPANLIVKEPGLLPGRSQNPLDERSKVAQSAATATIALNVHTPWRFITPKRGSCPQWPKLLSDHESADQESAAESMDNSLGEPLLDVNDAGQPFAAGEDVSKVTATLDAADACGPWRAIIGDLSKLYIELKAIQRRVGTLQTLWSAMVRVIIHPVPETVNQWRICFTNAEGKLSGEMQINPIERLLLEGFVGKPLGNRNCLDISQSAKTLRVTPQYVLKNPDAVIAALKSCGAQCNGGLLRTDDPEENASALKKSLASLGDETHFAKLVGEPRTQARFWKYVVDSGLLNVKNVLGFAGGIKKDVLDEREAFLRHGVIRVAAFRGSLALAARQVGWERSRIHDALVKAKQADRDYNELDADIRTATTIESALKAFVAQTDAVASAFAGTTKLDDSFVRVVESLDALDGALGAAIVELMEEPGELGAPVTPSAATTAPDAGAPSEDASAPVASATPDGGSNVSPSTP